MLNHRRQRGYNDESGDERDSLLQGTEFQTLDTTANHHSQHNQSQCIIGSRGENSAAPLQSDYQTTDYMSNWDQPSQHDAATFMLKSRGTYNSNQARSGLSLVVDEAHSRNNLYTNRSQASALIIPDDQIRRNSVTSDFIYYTIQPGDTLQNLSVRYSCPVSSIKRLNNLWSDQEFYGLTKIKLPVGKFRLIADLIGSESPGQESNLGPIHHSPISNSQLIHPTTVVPRTSSDRTHETTAEPWSTLQSNETGIPANLIFNHFDENIKKARTAAQSYNDHASAIMQTLAQNGGIVNEVDDDVTDAHKLARREAGILLNNMSDYGLSYNGLILFIFIVCLIFPLAYVIYHEETHHDSINKVHD